MRAAAASQCDLSGHAFLSFNNRKSQPPPERAYNILIFLWRAKFSSLSNFTDDAERQVWRPEVCDKDCNKLRQSQRDSIENFYAGMETFLLRSFSFFAEQSLKEVELNIGSVLSSEFVVQIHCKVRESIRWGKCIL